jgi:hypothetical protein
MNRACSAYASGENYINFVEKHDGKSHFRERCVKINGEVVPVLN